MRYLRYVAVGDSQTEGLNDGDETAGYRGWADRFAEMLAVHHPGIQYANLAIRGHRTRHVRSLQLDPALAMRPDLVTVMVGMNDLVRPGFDVDAVMADLDAVYAAFAGAGATILTFTYPDVTRISAMTRHLRPRLLEFNRRIRESARRLGVIVVDTESYEIGVDPRLWCRDRVHATPLGHSLIAAGAAHALGLPGADESWAAPLPPLKTPNRLARYLAEAVWVVTFLGPWLIRRLTGRSSGNGRHAKRPALTDVVPGDRSFTPVVFGKGAGT
ncbi:SGNH/GDSL hydrolase family protein [Herbidospora daliensis]|uniref:SGNH/GDSL hydrolase family protein n=1 Tax=Herbidospora daliensis TaxID=295585 RepID=UPI000781D179|nr:SGNH/GDSL hydrolase family protein [Herbidospora daliensis]